MGLLSNDLPPSDYWPRSFEMPNNSKRKGPRGIQFLQDAKLGEEQLIDFTLSIGF
jgi:hypothetical protein